MLPSRDTVQTERLRGLVAAVRLHRRRYHRAIHELRLELGAHD